MTSGASIASLLTKNPSRLNTTPSVEAARVVEEAGVRALVGLEVGIDHACYVPDSPAEPGIVQNVGERARRAADLDRHPVSPDSRLSWSRRGASS
jgi:hypothetical protein